MVAFCEHFFGIKPSLQGLRINPCLLSDWDQIKIKRVFRGKIYWITVLNKSKKGFGVKKLTINGQRLEGNLIPECLAKDLNEVMVEI